MGSVDLATGEITESLTAMERSALVHEEAAIEQGASQVAKALSAIRDRRLYRQDYSTFEAYCRKRWGMTRQHVNRQIVAAEVAAALEPMGSIPERQARELADLRDDPDQMRDVWNRANETTDGKPTAAAIREARINEGIDGKTYPASMPYRRGANPRPAAEISLNTIVSLADRAARETQKLTTDQIRRVKPNAAEWIGGIRKSVETLQGLLIALEKKD